MAFSSRLLSRSKQLYSGHTILQHEHAVPVRFFSKEAAPPALKGDEMLKNIFFEVKKKFETAMGILRKEKITIDPNDPAAVAQYSKVMKTVREKADLFSESQRIQYTIQTRTQGIPDARTYLESSKAIRINYQPLDVMPLRFPSDWDLSFVSMSPEFEAPKKKIHEALPKHVGMKDHVANCSQASCCCAPGGCEDAGRCNDTFSGLLRPWL